MVSPCRHRDPPTPIPTRLTLWIARFYVNTYTKKSQWEKPTEPARPPEDDLAPPGPPPSYTPGSGSTPAPSDTKVNPYEADNRSSNNPYLNTGAAASYTGSTGSGPTPGPSQSSIEAEDERLARQLQAEEDARARAAANAQGPFPNQLPPRPGDEPTQSRGLLGKLFKSGKKIVSSSSHGGHPHGAGPGAGGFAPHAPSPQPGYGAYASPPPPHGAFGAYPPQPGYGAAAAGYPPQPGYGGYPPPGGYGGYPPHGGYGAPPKRSGGGGMGMVGGAALGVGAGLLGGALIADAIHDGQEDAYQEGFREYTPPPLAALIAFDENLGEWANHWKQQRMVPISMAAATFKALFVSMGRVEG
ncbi:hypothetical protein MYCTH_2312547 [Thermothelomyces thermophilus ATCC 42464]|uniref:WW domain-containing protein n=1 Tax=Thermothelomyces thermophilus (strain ATCC 42464 / BCRC 31852 / DSM 1799) TaxID=573729 RepID=G2QMZ4_THET4|nr:uncharacterized protein MYCTH_2312547 [Thermothelomyces thermophilus ATCC 42464]AEO61867.1 hypothetical protein MYCTH_2312547 [Thermothelomyces thermophilus ATCC 42464]